jgi:hypothetical protein
LVDLVGSEHGVVLSVVAGTGLLAGSCGYGRGGLLSVVVIEGLLDGHGVGRCARPGDLPFHPDERRSDSRPVHDALQIHFRHRRRAELHRRRGRQDAVLTAQVVEQVIVHWLVRARNDDIALDVAFDAVASEGLDGISRGARLGMVAVVDLRGSSRHHFGWCGICRATAASGGGCNVYACVVVWCGVS